MYQEMKQLTNTPSEYISAKVNQYTGPSRSRHGKGYRIFNVNIKKMECKCWVVC